MKIDFRTVRERVPLTDFLNARGVELRSAGHGEHKAICPLHEERTPSFYVSEAGSWYCFGCGKYGDVVDLCSALDDISVIQAAEKLGAQELSTGEPAGPKPKRERALCILTAADLERMASAAHRLASSKLLIAKMVAVRPEWSSEAIRGAALDGDIGMELDCQLYRFRGPAILFGYQHGIKARWFNQDEPGKLSRDMRWIRGGPNGECWRQRLLAKEHRRVVIAEGETDTLTMISAGFESAGATLVVGLAGAHSYPDPEPFARREVVIVPDPDEAGRKSETKLRDLLKPVTNNIVTVRPEELLN